MPESRGHLIYGWDLGAGDVEVHWAYDFMEFVLGADNPDLVLVSAFGIKLPPNPWQEIVDRGDEWFYEEIKPGQTFREKSAEFIQWELDTRTARADFLEAQNQAIDSIPVSLFQHGSCDYRYFALGIAEWHSSVSWGQAVEVDLNPLYESRDGWDEQLGDAAHALGIEPPEQPELLLLAELC